MKEKRDCKIVQDLLPNYIEKLTNEETNTFIEEHIRECDDCKKVLENMQAELNISSAKRDGREVNYIKKFSKKIKALKFILLTLIIIYFAIVIRRTCIMVSLYQKAQANKSDNYYVCLYSYEGDRLLITESYNKGEDYLTIKTLAQDNRIAKVTYYNKDNEQILLSECGDDKYMLDFEKVLGGKISPTTYVSDGFLTNLQYALIIGIESTYCNGRECYVIKGNSYERYIDKETGLAVRDIEKSTKEISRENDTVIDYEYKFNIVTDGDIVKPDVTGYREMR
jgi:hypothetical protein